MRKLSMGDKFIPYCFRFVRTVILRLKITKITNNMNMKAQYVRR